MQIKTIMRYHLTPVRMTIINKSTNNKCWRRCGEEDTFLHFWWECELVEALWKTVPQKSKIRTTYPAFSLLGIYPHKTATQKDTCTPMFIAALSIVAKTWKQPKCPSKDEQIKKMWCIHVMEYYPSVKKKKII